MKKILIIVAGIAVVGVAIWSSLWFVGRGQIEDQLDLEVARAEARGTTITWETRDIGGFPFGYEMRARNLALTVRDTGVLVRVPEVISRSDASNIGQIDTRLIGDILVDLPLSEAQRAADPGLPKVAKLKITGDDLLASISGLGQSDQRVTFTASEIALKVDQDDLEGTIDIGASGANTVFQTVGTKSTLGVLADALVVQMKGQAQDGQVPTIDAGIDTLSLTATLDTPQTQNLNEILFGAADGTAELVYSTGRIAAEANVSDATGQGGGKFYYAGGTATGIIGIQRGLLEIRGESRQNVWTVNPNEATSTVAGTLSADAVQTHYVMPTGVSETPAEARLRLAVLELEADEALWTSLDPSGALDHAVSELLLDLDATARVTGRLDQMRPGQGVPIELSNVSLNTLNLSALGGEVNASGDVEVLQPINLPIGELNITMSKANAVLLGLKQAGLIDEQMRATGAAMLQVYARPGDGEDQWETDMTFGNDGITMNGLRVK